MHCRMAVMVNIVAVQAINSLTGIALQALPMWRLAQRNEGLLYPRATSSYFALVARIPYNEEELDALLYDMHANKIVVIFRALSTASNKGFT